jgi:uncharacterized protein (TIGR04552 family)
LGSDDVTERGPGETGGADESTERRSRPRLLSQVLTLGDLEQVRLILRGGSVVDWFRLQFETIEEVKHWLSLQEADPEDPADLARLAHLREVAVTYLVQEHGYRLPPDLLSCDVLDLFLYASAKRGRRRDRFGACLMLKVMHIVHHIEARELRYRLPLSQSTLADLLVSKVDRFAAKVRSESFPLVDYEGGQKTLSSLITKLLVKKEHHAATIHDRVRFRFVVQKQGDLLLLLYEMVRHLFPFNYLAPGQSINQLVNFTALVESHESYRNRATDLQIELGHEEQHLGAGNEFSGASFRVINFVVDVPIRVPDEVLAQGGDLAGLGRVVFGLAEFQVVDEATSLENEGGDNRHDRYKARQLSIVRARLEGGTRALDDG